MLLFAHDLPWVPLMAAVTAPPRGSLLGKVAASLHARAGARGSASKAAAFIADHSGTAAALGLIDTGLWHVSPVAGWIGTGVAVLVLEFKVRG